MATAVCGRLASDRKHTKGDGRRPGSMAQSPRYNVSSVATRIFRAVGTALTRSPPQIHALCTIYFLLKGVIVGYLPEMAASLAPTVLAMNLDQSSPRLIHLSGF